MSDSICSEATLSEREQLLAAREGTAVSDRNCWGVIQLTGDDRSGFLHNFCTNEIKHLSPATGCEAFFCNAKGRIVAHAWVVCQSDRILVILERDQVDFLVQHLSKYLITEDVKIEEVSEQVAVLIACGATALHSPGSAGLVVPDMGEETGFAHCTNEIAGSRVEVVSWNCWNVPGWMLLGERAVLSSICKQMQEAGGVVIGENVSEYLRISAVVPKYGVDLSDDNLAQEANRTRQAISFTKGCYLGQEPIARLDALGHVNRQVAGLKMPGEVVLTAGTQVLDSDGHNEVGTVTSAVFVKGEGGTVAMALLKSAFAKPGTSLLVEISGGERIPATVFRNE